MNDVRLLIVEDIEDHALLLVRALEKGGLQPVPKRVDTLEELERALDSGSWDAVISDFRLPDFTGLDALRLVQARGLDIPFLLVSGAIGEETAVEAMKAGVHDYIMKGQLSRLVPALKRELHDARIRREKQVAEEALRKNLDERVRILEELHEKERLLLKQTHVMAMGELVSNIAHHWRQPLNLVGILIQDLSVQCRNGACTGEYLDTTVDRAMDVLQRLSQTIDDFGYFFRLTSDKIRFRPKDVISKSVHLIEETLAQPGIRISVDCAGDLETEGHPAEYSQVIIHILMNARDALLEREVREPRIEIRAFRENERTVVTISDNAGGIDEAIADRIFEPYFTTKGPSQSRGLGLYMAKMIIEKNMGGRLEVQNSEVGAQFRIEV